MKKKAKAFGLRKTGAKYTKNWGENFQVKIIFSRKIAGGKIQKTPQKSKTAFIDEIKKHKKKLQETQPPSSTPMFCQYAGCGNDTLSKLHFKENQADTVLGNCC